MSKLSEIRKQLFMISLELGTIKVDMSFPFRWASNYMMPIYNDSRLLLSSPKARNFIAEGLELLLEGQQVCNIAGVATGGIAHAVLLANRRELPMQYIRTSAKSHGLSRKVEGLNSGYEGSTVAVIEDVISTGESSLQAIQAAQDAGGEVLACLAVYSYAFPKAEQAFAQAGISCQTILNLPQLLDYMEKNQLFSQDEIQQLKQWHSNPFTHPAQ